MAKGKSKLSTEDLMKLLFYVVLASVVIPIINTQMSGIEGDSTNYSASETLLAGLVTLFILLGLVYAIAKTVL